MARLVDVKGEGLQLLTRRLMPRFFVAAVIASQLLHGCGGGGGSGGGTSGPSLIPTPTGLSVSVALNSATPGDGRVTFATSNLPANANYIGGQYSNHGISSVDLGWNASGAPVMDVVYRAPGSLAVGTYQDTVQVHLCSDAACAHVIAGTTANIPVTYQVQAIAPGNVPTVSFAQTQIAYQGLVMDPNPPPQLQDAITLTNFGVEPYLSVSSGGSAKVTGFVGAQSVNTGTLTINLVAPMTAGAGTWTVPLLITACLDSDCVNPVAGSPFTVNVSYMVGNIISVAGPAGYTLTPVQQGVMGMVWDPAHSEIYALIPTGTSGGRAVSSIDPSTMLLGTQVPLSANTTGALDVSADSQYLYVGLTNGTVQRYQLPNLIPDIVIPLGADSQGRPLYARDVKVAPGAAHTIAVALSLGQFPSSAPNEAGVVIFDDAVRRANGANATQNPNSGTMVDYLAWGADASGLFGTGTTLPGLFIMSVDSQGIRSENNQGSFTGTALHFSGNLLYLDGGEIVDAATAAVVDSLSTYTELYGVIPDASLSKLFVSNSSVGPLGAPQLFALDLTTRAPINNILLPPLFMEQGHWLLASGGTLTSPVIVVSSTSYLGFITGAFVGP